MIPPHPHPVRECVKAVDKRAGALTEEYMKKAKQVDRVYGGVAEGGVQRKLEDFGEVRGLVFGAFGEASEGVHELVHALANSRLKAVGMQQGRQPGSGAGWENPQCDSNEDAGRVSAEQVE